MDEGVYNKIMKMIKCEICGRKDKKSSERS
jgi:hypothetical protein